MKFNLKLTTNKVYCEIGQINDLRWKTLYRNKDGSFTDQSGWIKCKDFFNDTVAFFKEKTVFSIYGYENDIKKNDEGVYFLLNNIQDLPSFLANIEVMNTQLKKDLQCDVWAEPVEGEPRQVVVCIPNQLWETTYRISMVTFVIRLCNFGVMYTEWADLWKTTAPAKAQERAFTPKALKNAETLGFLVPAGYEKYWWFAGPNHNSEVVKKQTGSIIHNNGVSNWSHFMEAQA